MSPALYLTVLLGLWMGAEACGPKENCCKVCPAGWAQFGSACYIYYHSAMAWADAEKFCTSIGGNLASVHSKDEYLYLRNAVLRTTGQHSTAWLGGYDAAKEGVWLWSDGSKFDFKFWAKGEPNNAGGHENCMEMNFRVCKTCPSGWSQYGKSCYIFHFQPMAWAVAEKHCTTEGGNLVSLHSRDEYDFIRNTLQRVAGRQVNIWLGGNDASKEGVWLWSDGSYFDFNGWNKGEPNNFQGHENCMEMNYEGRDVVNDNSCWKKKSFFCAKAL
ncbi:C-type mannose receptor 2-like [Xyrichtys novacula]|uniref:C-type mannose receptor 2-like n=1 Tax=Xyrichtys novacula TaxID=13765 RepID=A0AAV1HE25_XYRNO|nr:C-type mannose receptor 2-like [Xyrichtys novacula]